MGDVYQATDTRLGRSVAIKLLPDAFTRDADRVARFEREARAFASLNHSNIAAIHGLEESGERKFLVMELVEGETLEERIAQGPIPVSEALTIAKQIAEALEAAHEKGIIHRDLKPANVKITPDGKVKVLDFGLAKAFEPEAAHAKLSHSPTLSMAATNAGVILGTAAYMSPEQAKGRTVDRRTDIFAFGCVLFEMLTGRQAFAGDDVAEILARVLEREPDWTLLPSGVPPRIRELLRLCLEKNAKNRRSDAADVRIDIDRALTEPAAATPIAAPPRGSRLPWIAAALFGATTIAALAVALRPSTPQPEMRVEINTPATISPLQFALSPDGLKLAFVAGGVGSERLWVRLLDKTDAQPLAGTDGAQYPFWSPDSRSIAYFASGKLYRIDTAGGPPQALADAPAGRGGTWNRAGAIVFAPAALGPLMRVGVLNKELRPVTKIDAPRSANHRWPQFLPDGHHFLFYAPVNGIYLGTLDVGDPKRLTQSDTGGAYLEPGWLVYVQEGILVAQRLDIERGELTGDPVTLANSVGIDGNLEQAGFSVSTDGLVAYRGAGVQPLQLNWYDRTGKAAGTAGEPDANDLNYPALSPDGRRIAVSRTVQNNRDLWLWTSSGAL
jgi:eukaryotic-like serine/threonine-protein kinase